MITHMNTHIRTHKNTHIRTHSNININTHTDINTDINDLHPANPNLGPDHSYWCMPQDLRTAEDTEDSRTELERREFKQMLNEVLSRMSSTTCYATCILPHATHPRTIYPPAYPIQWICFSRMPYTPPPRTYLLTHSGESVIPRMPCTHPPRPWLHGPLLDAGKQYQ